MKQEPIRPTDDEARALARRLLANMRHANLGTLDPETGTPLVTRIAVQIDESGVPVALLSGLAAHTRALLADPRAGLLVTDDEAAKGDVMTHARLSVLAQAEQVPTTAEMRAAWLAQDPKAKVYIDLPDFRFWRLLPQSGLLNGGFGRAFKLSPADMLRA
ncbi:pyridoxamine 5'-phosphate oxidase family protein [Paracoccus sp. MBLB3053]|uniref:Pyridoxamine 5'-phosphate oxidase family protein n=1 Tax=Paracoccus aurantius TaxID=3073814 RepID=A0ABU2HXT6_9RHOB|nr:pyridoxamine 5'-phosphate oxidase family protein [Paracoccus sp. MBLB3053]MDS9469874.1 pyridoxamine 5'-phosphate oxidase family protein [Paracoccus sp. MBLB3053]